MDVLLETFGVLSTKVRSLERQLCSLNSVYNALNNFHRALTASTAPQRDSLWVVHQTELERIRVTLREELLRTSSERSIQSLYDRVFQNLLQSRQSHTTIVFTKFIKGISYFRSEEITDNTVYHRIQSCGGYRTNRKCDGGTHDTERRQRIYNCYLERLIWDAIYKFETPHIPGTFGERHTQDDAHEQRLRITRDEFLSCFPNSELVVDVECHPQPVSLVITFMHDDQVKYVEVYNRTVNFDRFGSWEYDLVVECHRTVKNKHYSKFQTFYNTSRWMPVSLTRKARSNTAVKTSGEESAKIRSV